MDSVLQLPKNALKRKHTQCSAKCVMIETQCTCNRWFAIGQRETGNFVGLVLPPDGWPLRHAPLSNVHWEPCPLGVCMHVGICLCVCVYVYVYVHVYVCVYVLTGAFPAFALHSPLHFRMCFTSDFRKCRQSSGRRLSRTFFVCLFMASTWPVILQGGGSFSNTDFGSFSNTNVLDHFRTQSGSFSNTWGGYPAAPVGRGGGGGVGSYVRFLLRDRAAASWGWGWGQLRSPLTA